MNEAENQVRPNEVEANVENDFTDVEGFDEIVNDFDNAVDDLDTSEEDTSEPETEEVSKPTETNVEGGDDFTPFLNKLSKDIKYMDEEVDIKDYNEVVEYIQKGKDYDRKTKRLDELENSEEMTYIKTKAQESNMTPKEYIQAIKDYEAKQEQLEEEQELNEMIENGVAESIAKKVIETNKVAKELKAERAKLAEQQRLVEEQNKKTAENEAFLKEYPDVNLKEIPKEVFIEAEKIGLLSAYARYENNKLKTELETLRKNQSNKDSSPVKATTEHGGVVVEPQDDFLKGFGLE